MKITVRCFLIPAEITFNTDDVEVAVPTNKNAIAIFFKGGGLIEVDKQHYFDEKNKK